MKIKPLETFDIVQFNSKFELNNDQNFSPFAPSGDKPCEELYRGVKKINRENQINNPSIHSPSLEARRTLGTNGIRNSLLLFFISTSAFAMHHEKMDHTTMHGMYGPYPISRESSGTAWVPDSSPLEGIQKIHHDWHLMFMGYSYLVFDHQGGCRGGKKVFDENMWMIMTHKETEHGTLGFRAMVSLEPATIGKCGYPLLFQTGETCNGKTPLINRQHPHDMFMELAVTYSKALSDRNSWFLYFGMPGEPALGPPVYIMRFSSEYNPEAPLTHHWIDSTHITFGVLTLGAIHNATKIEASLFTGREPDQHRFNFDKPRFDSGSLRISWNPNENISLQASYGFLKSPEQLEACVNSHRFRFSGIYNKSRDPYNWQTIAVIGVNKNKPGHTLPAFLLDSTFEWLTDHLVFGRFEVVNKDDLFVCPDLLANKIVTVKKLSGGYIKEYATKHIKWGLGAVLSGDFVPKQVEERYKKTFSYMVFLQLRLMERESDD